jgi:hypothetical protein
MIERTPYQDFIELMIVSFVLVLLLGAMVYST